MSREAVFVDTGAWLALSLVDDQYHSFQLMPPVS
jgi:predicted nucleic acid-binding protein